MPDFADVDPVPVRSIEGPQKKIDRGGACPSVAAPHVPEDFAKVPTFRVGTKVEFAYEGISVASHKAV
jgi:hypothetical protein